eukprot:Hpha_TRINITY_DN16558_c1_g7::TRINITY_DN16558_c1_g7_i1::g.135468::m.135468
MATGSSQAPRPRRVYEYFAPLVVFADEGLGIAGVYNKTDDTGLSWRRVKPDQDAGLSLALRNHRLRWTFSARGEEITSEDADSGDARPQDVFGESKWRHGDTLHTIQLVSFLVAHADDGSYSELAGKYIPTAGSFPPYWRLDGGDGFIQTDGKEWSVTGQGKAAKWRNDGGVLFPAQAVDAGGTRRMQVFSQVFEAGNIKALRACYIEKMAFPSWVRTDHPHYPPRHYDWESTKVYYGAAADASETEHLRLRADATKLLLGREPANIDCEGYYHKERLMVLTGRAQSEYYLQFKESPKRLPTNVAVYCYSPLVDQESSGVAADPCRNLVPKRHVHIMNVVGPAFDDRSQPDYQYYLGGEGKMPEHKRKELELTFERIFGFIFTCAAETESIRTVALSLFGCNNFARLFRGDGFQQQGQAANGGHGMFLHVYLPSLRKALLTHKAKFGKGKGLIEKVAAFGTPGDVDKMDAVIKITKGVLKDTVDYGIRGTFPRDEVFSEKGGETLAVNAWDPHSIAGNGNSIDNSLDGYVGRHTAIGVLCWPGVNSAMKYKAVLDPPLGS